MGEMTKLIAWGTQYWGQCVLLIRLVRVPLLQLCWYKSIWDFPLVPVHYRQEIVRAVAVEVPILAKIVLQRNEYISTWNINLFEQLPKTSIFAGGYFFRLQTQLVVGRTQTPVLTDNSCHCCRRYSIAPPLAYQNRLLLQLYT